MPRVMHLSRVLNAASPRNGLPQVNPHANAVSLLVKYDYRDHYFNYLYHFCASFFMQCPSAISPTDLAWDQVFLVVTEKLRIPAIRRIRAIPSSSSEKTKRVNKSTDSKDLFLFGGTDSRNQRPPAPTARLVRKGPNDSEQLSHLSILPATTLERAARHSVWFGNQNSGSGNSSGSGSSVVLAQTAPMVA